MPTVTGRTFEKGGYTNFQLMTIDLVTKLIANGFILKYPAAMITAGPGVAATPAVAAGPGGIPPAAPAVARTLFTPMLNGLAYTGPIKFTLEAGPNVDALSVVNLTATPPVTTEQPWRIQFDASDTVADQLTDPGTIRVYTGTLLQLPDDGTVTLEYPGTMGTSVTAKGPGLYPRRSGELTCGYFTFTAGSNVNNLLSVPFVSKHFSDYSVTAAELSSLPVISVSTVNTNQLTDSDVDYKGANSAAHPNAYRCTISDHGLALCVWEEGQDVWGNRFSWFVIQRPVKNDTGMTLGVENTNSRCPVFCVYSIGGGEPTTTKVPYFDENATSTNDAFSNMGLPRTIYEQLVTGVTSQQTQITLNPDSATAALLGLRYIQPAKIYRFTVREVDVHRPTVPVFATLTTPDNNSVINAKEQVSITEGNQYIVSFINGFNTSRYVYKEEIDMITYCSADVISATAEITLQPYKTSAGAAINVKYKAMQANLPDNAGMRILMLTNGQGVDGSIDV